ncbi:MAG: hypothetical protein JJE13_13345 [Thermoleophilia bacterium]|nr:hypothetical protein [Thermoleophilia bacterium]
MTDESHYIAYTKADGVPVVFDTKTSETVEIEGADDCIPAAIGAGQVLLQCSSPSVYFHGAYRRARTASVDGGPSVPFFKLSPSLDLWAIGRYWVGGSQSCGGGCPPPSPWYINRRTGKKRLISYDDHPYRNVDSKKLNKIPDAQPFTVKIKGKIVTQCSNTEVVVTNSGGFLRLWTDPHTSTVIGKSVYAAFSCSPYPVQFSEDKVAWQRGRTLNTVDIDSGKRVQQNLGRSLEGWAQPPLIMDRGSAFTDQGKYLDDDFNDIDDEEVTYRIRFFPLN